MAVPFVPILLVATVVAVVRQIQIGPVIQAVEDTLDTVDEGVWVGKMRDEPQVNAAFRWKRVVRLGADGPGVEIDVSALGRLRIRKV